ncbi:hypothetical protein [Snuella lapsa]|uniref:Uncharacterized protein n=1 Tax=Snuella lapsa TaxID=870481 RepID=A0ABP6YB58_9FLAO
MKDNNQEQKIKEKSNYELNGNNSEPNIQEISPQDKFLETLIEKGGQVLMGYTQMSQETQKYSIDRQSEIEKEELKTANKFDIRDKIYKGILIVVCIISLILSDLFIEKAEVVIPVLTLIIGLLFKTNSLSDFRSLTKDKYDKNNESE